MLSLGLDGEKGHGDGGLGNICGRCLGARSCPRLISTPATGWRATRRTGPVRTGGSQQRSKDKGNDG